MKFTSLLRSASRQLRLTDLNESTLKANYAVRGAIPIRAGELQEQIAQNPHNHGLPFDQVIHANIGNPQQLNQQALTWYRQVLSLLQYPGASASYPKDVVERAQTILKDVSSVGAYSNSQGSSYVRKSVTEFIKNRDGFAARPEDIFLTSGASAAVSYLIQVLATENSAFLIPIPQYPLYTASIALNNSHPIGYYLKEEDNWNTDPEEIRELIAKNKEYDIKALVVINPGNPTGSILDHASIVKLIDVAADHGLVIIADEVYQNNVFESEFISFRKVLNELKQKDFERYSTVQLASLHSTSKGVSGECGQRGGYMELEGFTEEVKAVLFKLACINLCSVVSGQALVELMVNPPKEGSPSYELYQKETNQIYKDLKERSQILHAAFMKMQDVTCNKPQGAMYLFPRLNFSEEKYPALYDKARQTNSEIDDVYCMELLENTGICCVPGNGFGQEKGTWHLRTTFLPPGLDWIDRWSAFHKEFVTKFSK